MRLKHFGIILAALWEHLGSMLASSLIFVIILEILGNHVGGLEEGPGDVLSKS